MPHIDISPAAAAIDLRFTSNADFQALERMVELYGLRAVLLELVTLTSMDARHAATRSRRIRNMERSANLDMRADYLSRAAEALVRAADEAESAEAIPV